MWESFSSGNLWHKVTAPDAEQSATCIVQDRRAGKHSTWYYGSGELLSTTDRNVSTSVRTVGAERKIATTTSSKESRKVSDRLAMAAGKTIGKVTRKAVLA